MLFNSLSFLVFLSVILLLYYAPIFNWSGKKRLLLFGSYLFYAMWNPPLIVLLWISTVVDFWVGRKLRHTESQKHRKGLLLLSMVINLGFLAFFKYGNFLLDNFILLSASLGWEFTPRPMDILLPMGISFYTFQTMSYTIDMYYKRIEPAKTFLDFALYVTFFPQLVAGPIVRAKDLITQFYEEKKAKADQFLWGVFLLSLGLFQKVVLADSLLASTADAVFSKTEVLNFWDAWAGVLAFSGQIFFDFAGYSTCAIGIAAMLGFWLPDNFLYPYGAIGFSDLWKRWHITLSTWLRDYLYIPLGGNRFGITRMYAALMITMLLGGLWHGAAWTFVVWGGLHGLYLVAERILRNNLRIHLPPSMNIIWAFITFTLVNITWVFFRAQEFSQAGNLLHSMFLGAPDGLKVLGYFDLFKVFTVVTILFLTHWFMRDKDLKEVTLGMKSIPLGIIWGLMLLFLVMAQGSEAQFIYFQF